MCIIYLGPITHGKNGGISEAYMFTQLIVSFGS